MDHYYPGSSFNCSCFVCQRQVTGNSFGYRKTTCRIYCQYSYSPGTVQPVDTVAVGTQVSGTISKVYADFNSKVKKGQLLAELDKTILNAQVQQIVSSIQQAQSQLTYQQSNFDRQSQLYNAGAISKADLETAQNGFKVAQAGLRSAQSQLQAAQKNLSLASIYSPIDGTVLSRNVSEGQT